MHPPGRQVDPGAGAPRPGRAAATGSARRAATARARPRRRPRRRTALRRPRSSAVFDGPERAAARAYLKGIGFDDEALRRPTIGVANTWIETMPCNFHLRGLAANVKEGIRAAGGTPMEFNTIAISDGITMGTEGHEDLAGQPRGDRRLDRARPPAATCSTPSIALSGCDKTIPGSVMALARLDVPSLMLYGGSILPGRCHGHDVTIQDVFEAIGAHAAGKMTRRGAARARGRAPARAPAPAAASSPPTRWPGVRGARDLARWARRWSRPRTREKATVADEVRRAGHGRARRRPAPQRDHHQGLARERDRRRRACPAARPTACCTCSRSPARPASS